MKKLISVLLSALVLIAVFAGCGSGAATSDPDAPSAGDVDASAPVVVRLGGLTGPTGMGLSKLLADNEAALSANAYDFTLAGSAEVLSPMIITGELDVAAIPANLASILYNKTKGEVVVLAINTLGVLYIVNNDDSVSSLDDLKGKTIYATGQGAAPEYVLRYVLSQNGVDPDKDLTIDFKTEPAEVVSLMAAGEGTIAMLPQPYVTVAKGKLDNLKTVVDMTAEWDKLGGSGMCLTGVTVARRDFVEQHPQEIESFLAEYAASIDYVNANIDDAAALIGKYEIIAEAVAKKAIPECNITCITGEDMKQSLAGYLGVLFEQNPASVGGALPADDFYYLG